MLKVTISGHPGSGTSTLVSLLCETKGWSSLNGGELFRQEAKRRNMSLADFGQLCKEDLEVDRQLDSLLKEQMEKKQKIIEINLTALRLELRILKKLNC